MGLVLTFPEAAEPNMSSIRAIASERREIGTASPERDFIHPSPYKASAVALVYLI
jgi:hypothetical protein